MAAGGQAVPPPQVAIPVGGDAGIGDLTIAPPTFLEKWGVVFVSVGGIWMLGVCIAMLGYYLGHLPGPPPTQSPAETADQYRQVLDNQKLAVDHFRDSLNFAFDLMVTKTILPLITLLLGYLFGSKKAA
jgi:hypothetical protein